MKEKNKDALKTYILCYILGMVVGYLFYGIIGLIATIPMNTLFIYIINKHMYKKPIFQ